ncbi:MAG: TIGR01212 family radical SAM protein [Candidatus Omnitrophica bacterium]|nr:TIGR01212 family radical SAM protein [Candidatus Omnitrophota bacterium]
MKTGQKYYKFSEYLKEKYNCVVYKVSIDAGFNCPNIDGKLSRNGCIYCDNRTFSFNTRTIQKPVEEQIKDGIDFGRKRFGAEKFIVYFQAYTNTYEKPDILKQRYDTVRKFKDIVGVTIGTRPDCVSEEILDLIKSYESSYDVWVEYGLQSMHDKTLKTINRNHTYQDFLKAIELARAREIKICAHVILGLPGETEEDITQTAKELGRLKIDAVKIHPLYITKDTALEGLFKKGVYKPLTLNGFIKSAINFLEQLSPGTVIQRIGADCPREFLIEPQWILDKGLLLRKLQEALDKINTYQGRLYEREIV